MAYRRRARHDDSNHAPIVDAIREAGRQWIELDGAKQDEPGLPDGVIVWPGGIVFCELKSIITPYDCVTPQRKQLSPSQVKWHAAYRGPRGSLVTVWTEAEALRACGVRV